MNSLTAVGLEPAGGQRRRGRVQTEWSAARIVNGTLVDRAAVALLALLHHAVAAVRLGPTFEACHEGVPVAVEDHFRHGASGTLGEHPVVSLVQLQRYSARHDVVAVQRLDTGHTFRLILLEILVVVGAKRVSQLVGSGQRRDGLGQSIAAIHLCDDECV